MVTTLSLVRILSQCHNFADMKRGSLEQLARLIDSCWDHAEKCGMKNDEIEKWLIEVLND